MRLYPMSASQARRRLAQAGSFFAAAVLVGGCGNNYRPVVTPVNSSGPPSQPISYAVTVSAPSPSSAGVATVIDFSGDAVMAQAPIGIGPLAFTIDEVGGTGYTFNSDHTITNFPVSTSLQQKQETVTTLPSTAQPLNILAPAAGLWIGDLTGNVADVFTGSPQTFQLAVPMAPDTVPAFIAGAPTSTGQRQYVINQNIANPTGVECNQTPTAEPLGTAVPVEMGVYTIDRPAIPVGRCPVFAVQSPDQRRLFVLNRGDDTITVINTQNNSLDACTPFTNQNGQLVTCHPTLPLSTTAVTNTGITPPNGTTGMTAIAGPVYAEYNQATAQLVVSNYDGNTVSIIDVSLDQYGNDSPTFGTTYTVPVGTNPASVTVLFDGSRAYTANQTDGTVTVVNLSSHSVEKTLTVTGHPRTVVSTQNSLYGKVYAASPDTPYLTILETEHDLEDATILLQGNIVDVRTTTQSGAPQNVATYSGSVSINNSNFSSRIPGFGQPCNLPPALMASTYGANYTLANCRAIP
jgi:YVTN family beta-propeller protein